MSHLRQTLVGRVPRTAMAAIVVAAMGIGLSGAALRVVYSYLLKPSLASRADQVYFLYELDEERSAQNLRIAYPALLEWGERNTCFEKFAVEKAGFVNLRVGGVARSSMIGMVSPGYLDVRGARLQMGRDLSDQKIGAPEASVVVSNRLWSSMPPTTELGSLLSIGDQPLEIVGVASANLDASGLDAWIDIRNLPLIFPGANAVLSDWASREARGLVRLEPSCSEETVNADLERVSRALESVSPASHSGVHGRLERLHEKMLSRVRGPLLSFSAAALLGLLLATFNIVILLVHDAMAGARDRATRIALGATPGRITRRALLDVLLITTLGGLLALPIYILLKPALDSLIPRSLVSDLGPSGAGLGLLSIVVPAALLAAVVSLSRVIHLRRDSSRLAGQRGFTSPLQARWISGLIVFAQIALASGSAFLASNLLVSYWSLRNVDAGYHAEGVVAVGVSLPADQYADRPSRYAYFERARARLMTLPGVVSVTAGLDLPLQGVSCWEKLAFVEAGASRSGTDMACQLVGPDYFETLGVAVVRGRVWTHQHFRDDVVRQVMVNESFARTYFANAPVIGSRLRLQDESLVEVIGVVADVHQLTVGEPIVPLVYLPGFGSFMQVFLRSVGGGAQLIEQVEYTLTATESDIALYSSRLAESVVLEETRHMQTLALTVVVSSVVSMLVGLVGVYAVVVQAVRRRRQEFLVRMAFGATPLVVARRLLTPIVLAAGIGLCAGGLAYFATMPLFRQLLHGISAERPALIVGGVALMVLAAALSSGGIATLELRRSSLRDVVRFGISD